MRIITGQYRGRKLESPVGNDVRPTTDKVKEAIFNLLMLEVQDSICVDLFAGSGSLGLEALSRGATRCYFCDNSRSSINLIKENIKKCKAEGESVVIAGDYSKALSRLEEKIDIFLLDPPYREGMYEKCLSQIDSQNLLSDGGTIIAEHGSRDILPEHIGQLEKIKVRKYGTMSVSVYRHVVEENQ